MSFNLTGALESTRTYRCLISRGINSTLKAVNKQRTVLKQCTYVVTEEHYPYYRITPNSNANNSNVPQGRILFMRLVLRGSVKNFEPDYLPLDFWARKKCYWP